MLHCTIGTRGSALALAQTGWVRDKLQKQYANCRIRVVPLKTTGDRREETPVSPVGGKGLFVKEIEKALSEGTIDLAVHSMKDLPVQLPAGLVVAAITQREDPLDVFVSETSPSVEGLRKQATVATGSPRRKAQLLHYRSDLVIREIRGNVDTRLHKLKSGFAQGLVLAAAGLRRLKRSSRISQYLHPDIVLPAAGQGALGIEVRATDRSLIKSLSFLNHPESQATVTAERSCMYNLGVDCHTPAAAYGEISGTTLTLSGMIASPDGRKIVREKIHGPTERAEMLGELLAQKIRGGGGGELLACLVGK